MTGDRQPRNEPLAGDNDQRPALANVGNCSNINAGQLERLSELAGIQLADLQNPSWSDSNTVFYDVDYELRSLWNALSVESKLVACIAANRISSMREDARDIALDLDRFL